MDGKITWQKPISCHLYPIKIKKTSEYELLNYEPRESLCSPACALGKKSKMPVYVFLKNAIVRKYGAHFFEALEKVAKEYFGKKAKQE
jgi:isocitrate dehydrogenase